MKTADHEALVARTVAYGESDLVVTLLTRSEGRMGAIARGARRSRRRMGGALEPFHTIRIRVEDRGTELVTLREAQVVRVRATLVTNLEAVEAAGRALRWARVLCPPRTPEPLAFTTLETLLDSLDAGDPSASHAALAIAGLRLLADVGYALEFERCVACGRSRPKTQSASVDPSRGGLVCTPCGGGRRLLDGPTLGIASRILAGERPELTGPRAEALLHVVADAMAVHAGIER